MTYHHVWLTKCNGDECSGAHVEATAPADPEGWATDGTQHLCPDCARKAIPAEESTEGETVAGSATHGGGAGRSTTGANNGTANTGGGGGGGIHNTWKSGQAGGAGGSGIVRVRYLRSAVGG